MAQDGGINTSPNLNHLPGRTTHNSTLQGGGTLMDIEIIKN